MTRERDSQRSRVYKAERAIRKEYGGKHFRETADVERYIKKQFARKTITRRYGDIGQHITAHDGRGRGRAGAWGYNDITLPKWTRFELMIIHEVAHLMTNRLHGLNTAGHGWQFCSIYLDLVRFILGKEAHAALKASFKAHKVKFKKPQTRAPLSPEQKALLAECLAAAREAKKSATANH